MNFKTATDRLADFVTHADIAQEAGVSLQSIRQARLDPSNPNYRKPPANWRAVLATLARERGGRLDDLTDELEGDVS